MKTITLKADAQFDAELSQLATAMAMPKSAVIKAAVRNYKKTIEREALANLVRQASLKTRDQVWDDNQNQVASLPTRTDRDR